jgi:hypothetical protein
VALAFDSFCLGDSMLFSRLHALVVFLFVTRLTFSAALCDEGMFPISELNRLDLPKKGLELRPDEIFNPNGLSLVDGICRVNGCTGSFVSDQGLIITNHHCAFDAIQKASTTSRDLLKEGFVSRSLAEEIPAPGYTVRITEQYRDVSTQVLDAVTAEMSFLDRTKAIDKKRKEIEKATEESNPGFRAEVAEMFVGKTYVLFLYTYLKDIRLVFAPPASIGEFGGETDNWEWPRHTGDFSFLRAYVSPDGKSADYSDKNVPYRPKRLIPIAKKGADEGDFVFILGYPGRTVRQRTASYFEYEQNVRLPAIVDSYSWQMREMTTAGEGNRDIALKHATRFKSLANVEKRSRGQVLGLKRTGLIEERKKGEAKLQAFIESDPKRKQQYGTLLADLDEVYSEMIAEGPYEIAMQELRTACRALSFAYTIYEATVEAEKADLDREAPYMTRNLALTTQQLKLAIGDWHPPTDRIILRGMVERLEAVPEERRPETVTNWLKKIRANGTFIDGMFDRTKVGNWDWVQSQLGNKPSELAALHDPMIDAIIALYPTFLQLRDLDKERQGQLSRLYGLYIDVRKEFEPTQFVPDANATLRLTYGRVKGYSPADAVYKQPISTLRGVIEKTTGVEPFVTPERLLAKYRDRKFGGFVHPKLQDVPVAILYNTDTTGGNSGSPVINAHGELVGVNFDRTFEATINDFAWNDSYSRSIGVDVRYVQWVTGIVYGADNLLKEMAASQK